MPHPVAAALAAGFVVTLAACGESLRPEDIPNITGSWAYSESMSAATATCELVGTLSFEQSFETFVGSFTRTVTCSGHNRQSLSSIESGPITQGKVIKKDAIEFRLGSCDYRGTLTENPPERLSGSALCLTASANPTADAGTWEAKRLTDPTP